MSLEFKGMDVLLDVIRNAPDQAVAITTQRMREFTVRLARHIKMNKLSGQVLHVRTGNLRDSIHPEVTTDPNSVIGTVGTGVKYGVMWEFGGPIKGYTRLVKTAWGRTLKFPVWGTWKDRVIAPRSFIRTGMEDKLPEARQMFGANLVSEVFKRGSRA